MTTISRVGLTRELALWTSNIRYEDLPADVVESAKILLRDFARAVVIGATTPSGRAANDLVRRIGGTGRSTVLSTGEAFDAPRAALVNGCLTHATDIDDTHIGSMLHPAAVVLPAALAMGQDRGASGADLIAAMVVGYEVAIRIGSAMQPSHFARGFQATGTCGVLGAATAAARIAGLDATATAGALGAAGSMAGGLAQFYYSGSSIKRISPGLAAHNGALCALMAEVGIAGPNDVIEGRAGFLKAYADVEDFDSITDHLGVRFALSGVILKPHATSARLQASVEALLEIISTHRVDPADIVDIEVGIPQVISGRLTQTEPPDITSAQMSLPVTLAVVAVSAHADPMFCFLAGGDYRRHFDDPQVRRLARLTRCVVDEDIERATTAESVPSRIAIRLADGSQVRANVESAPGVPANPLTAEQQRELLSLAVGADRPELVTDIYQAVEQLGHGGSITQLCHSIVAATTSGSQL